jgi:hypothetical protein
VNPRDEWLQLGAKVGAVKPARDVRGLRCDKCGAAPSSEFVEAGGSHIRTHVLEFASGKRETRGKTCGKWRPREPGEEG